MSTEAINREKGEPICLWIDRLVQIMPTLDEQHIRKALVELTKESLFEGVDLERRRALST